jgi:hypothetical protein
MIITQPKDIRYFYFIRKFIPIDLENLLKKEKKWRV